MKKNSALKWCSIVGAVLLAIGLVITLIMYMVSGVLGFAVSTPPTAVVAPLSSTDQTSAAPSPGTQVRSMKLDMCFGDVTLSPGTELSVSITPELQKYCKYYMEGDTLVVKDSRIGVNNWFGMKGHMEKSRVDITLPQGTVITRLAIDNGAGDVRIDGLTIDEVEIDTGAGDVDISSVTTSGEISLNSGAGDVELRDVSTGRLNVDTGAGDLTAVGLTVGKELSFDVGAGDLDISGDLRGNIEVDNGMGDTRLSLTGSRKDYAISTSTMGDVDIDGEQHGSGWMDGEYEENKGAENSIRIDSSMGSVAIDFAGGVAQDEK